jgi:hypothetical protein
MAISTVDGHVKMAEVVMWRHCGDGGSCWLVVGHIVLEMGV